MRHLGGATSGTYSVATMMKRLAVSACFLCSSLAPVLQAQGLAFYPAPGSPFSSGSLPGFFNTGDFNGDGNPDLLVGTTLMLGDGHGKFTRSPGPALPPGSSVVGDFNGDGRSDVAIANFKSLSFSVYLGNSDGTFTLARGNLLNISRLYASGDFNGDGKLDLLAEGPQSVVLLLGTGTGDFTLSPVNLPANIAISDQVADFNGDGRSDLVGVANLRLTILLGDGRGNFTAASSVPFEASSLNFVVGDFNGDGKPDVAVQYVDNFFKFLGAGATVLLGDGAGGLSFASTLPSPGSDTSSRFTVADLNGDGKQDLIVSSSNRNTVTVLLGDGTGTFANASGSPYNIRVPPLNFSFVHAVAAADFNRDGRTDLAVLGTDSLPAFALLLNGVGSIATDPAQVTFNAAAGQPPPAPIAITVSSPSVPTSTFSVKTDQPWLTANPIVGATGAPVAVNLSINTNGLTAGTYHGAVTLSSPNFLDGSVAVMLNVVNPSKELVAAPLSRFNTGKGPTVVALADFDRDGNLDVAVANATDRTVSVFRGDGSGRFLTQFGTPAVVPVGVTSLTIADFNTDGKPDLLVSGTEGTAVLLNNGTRLLAGNPPLEGVTIVAPVVVADFDGNGTLDSANSLTSFGVLDPIAFLYPLFGDGVGGFVSVSGPGSQLSPTPAAVVGDFNGDGRQDVALVANNSAGKFVQVSLNAGGGAFTWATKAALPVGVIPSAAAAGDFNGDGKLDIAIAGSGTLLVLLGDGKGNFNSSPTLLPLAADSGPQGIAVADLNGDGKLDIVIANSAGVTMFLGDGAGGFATAPGSPVSVGVQSSSVAVGDLNHDGIPDLIVGNLGGNDVSVFLGSSRSSNAAFRLTAQRITISPASLTFFQSGPSAASQSISIAGASIGFSATVTSGGTWLQISPATGAGPATLTASVNTAGLTSGSYNGQITIAFNDGTPSQAIGVTLTIAVPAQIEVSSTFLEFIAERGSSPPAQSLQVTFSGATTTVVQGNAPWLSVSQSNAATLLISVNPLGFANGAYEAVLAISAPGASTALVRVRMTVQDGPQFLISTKQITFTYQAGRPNPPAQTFSVNATGRHFSFTVASNQPWLSVTPQAAMTPVFLNVMTSPAGMGTGVYDGIIALSSTDATNSPQSVAVRLIVQSSTPIFTASHILNAATLAPGPLAPGSLFTITGTNLAIATLRSSSTPLPTSIGETSVSFGGIAAPLLYVSATQINGQVPFEVGLGQTAIVVTRAAIASAPAVVTIAQIAPGLFQTDSGRAAVLNQDGAANDVLNPAAPNSIISAFLTGQGAVDHPAATGWPALADPLSLTTSEVEATFDGQTSAEVLFAGLAPTLVGVLQVNLRVPVLSVGDHTLVVSINGMASNPAAVSIGPEL
jgi:uncharacterized protein (TIGR03437 family)